MTRNLVEKDLVALGLCHLFDKVLREAHFLDLDPGALLLSDEIVAHLVSLLYLIEVVDDDTDEEVDNELTADDHKGDEVGCHDWLVVELGLHVDSSCVHTIVHHTHPAFRSHHLEQSHHRIHHVVKVYVLILPGTTCVDTVLPRHD